MKQHIAILLNSKAGNGKGVKIATTICNYLETNDIVFTLFKDDWAEDLNTFSAVWVIGGDGTLNYFINKYKNCNIPIAIFKGGTGNDFAWMLCKEISLEQQLELVLKSSGKFVDVGICNNQLFVNGVGIGFDGEILKSITAARWIGGHLGYLLVVIKKIFSFKEYSFNISIDEQEKSGKFLLVSVFNSVRTGGGFYIAPKATINDGKLDIILCKPLSIFNRLLNLPKIEKGKHLHRPFIDFSNAQKIIVECENDLPAQIDGELIVANKFEIEIIKNKFLFLY